jgi:hypothetical protein
MIEENSKSLTDEQKRVLTYNYGERVINHFVKNDLLKNFSSTNLDLDEFFRQNHVNLKHPIVREKLRHISEKNNFLQENDPNLVSRQRSSFDTKETQRYKYTLPNINGYGEDGKLLKENYGSNNYDKIKHDDDEIVQSEYTPKVEICNFGNENLRIRNETDRIRQEQLLNYRRECLFHHNRIRALHGSPALRENHSLTNYAQQWANFLSESDTLTHSSMIWDGKNVGENIAKAGAVINDPSQLIVNKWYEEKENYDFSKNCSQNNTKNFTQIVWKDTTEIGFGLAYSQTGNTFIVVNYYPSGNISNEYDYNVRKSQ